MKQVFLLTVLMLVSFSLKGQDSPPNILLIISDQHSGLFMNQTGYTHLETPGINRIAELGVTFTRSYCTYPVCVAARASFMTGMMPSKSNRNLTSYPSIGKTMLDSGYETAYFGKWHVSNSKLDRVADWHGFEQYEDTRRDTKAKELTIEFLKQKREQPFFMITSFLN